jgi:MFS family permease
LVVRPSQPSAAPAPPGHADHDSARAPFWSSLVRFPTYRWFWLATMAGSVGQWMQQVALGWLALTMTNSPSFVGIVSFTAGVPFLVVAPLGGSLIDRFDRQRMMLVCQALSVVLALVVAADVISGRVAPWHLVVAAFLTGSLQSLLTPTQQSLVPALVDRTALTNAIGLMSAGQNMTRIAGPSLAGSSSAPSASARRSSSRPLRWRSRSSWCGRSPSRPRSRCRAARRPGRHPLIARRPDLRGLFLLASLPAVLIFPVRRVPQRLSPAMSSGSGPKAWCADGGVWLGGGCWLIDGRRPRTGRRHGAVAARRPPWSTAV